MGADHIKGNRVEGGFELIRTRPFLRYACCQRAGRHNPRADWARYGERHFPVDEQFLRLQRGANPSVDTGQDSGKSPKQFQRVSRNLLDRTGADWVIAMYPQASQSSAR